MSMMRRIRRLLAGRAARRHADSIYPIYPRERLIRATLLVRCFYVALLFLYIDQSRNWQSWLSLRSFDLLWPVRFINWTGPRLGIGIIVFLACTGALAAAAFPQRRAARVLAALATLLYGAFWNSFGIIMHGWHGWIWVSFLFIFLPDGIDPHITGSRARRQRYLTVFFSAQAAILLFYSLSGFFKLAAAGVQIYRGEPNAFLPEALPRLIAGRHLEGVQSSDLFIGPWLIRHPYVAWPLYLTALYLESMSFIVAFRPAIHRGWAIALILFHTGILFALTILFSWQVLLVGILLLCSPFAPQRTSPVRILLNLPLIGDLLSLVWRKPKAPSSKPA